MRRGHIKGDGTRVKNNVWVKPLLLIVIVCGLTFVTYKSGLFHFFISKEKILKFLDSLGPAAFVGFILLQVIQAVVAPIPGEVTGLLGGFL